MNKLDKKIKISIIIPHKNSFPLLRRCISSIPFRDDIQIIVVDDCSDISLGETLDYPYISQSNVEYFFNKVPLGAGHARNIGLQHAIGEWIMFADADDYYIPNAFDIIENELDENIDILYYNVCADKEGINSRVCYFNKLYAEYAKTQKDYLVRFGCWTPWNKVLRHSFIEEYHIRFDEIPVGNDAMFALMASDYTNKFKIIQDKLYVLTENPNSITYVPMSFERKMDYLKVNVRINDFMVKHGYNDLCLHLLGIVPLKNMLSLYGVKKTFTYLWYIHKHWKMRYAIRRWILQLSNKLK